MIKKPQRSVPKDSINIGGYTYMKIKIHITPNKRDFIIYQDTKTNRILVSYAFLVNFSDIDITKVFKPTKIAGYLDPIIKL